MKITVLEECQTTHLLTYNIDANSLEEAKTMILQNEVDYREREWINEDAHYFDKNSFKEIK